ncbi:MAG: hypothetical protein U9Q83_07515 [Bacteroidota bacterium]|nr:hypothetical protein [Bacteroidota bacterium]
MNEAKDKKIIDAYMKKHPNASAKKIERYAEKQGIHINVMPDYDYKKLKAKMMKDAGLPLGLDLESKGGQIKLLRAVTSMSKEKQAEFLSIMQK